MRSPAAMFLAGCMLLTGIAWAQAPPVSLPEPMESQAPQTSADEDIRLDIAERRITEDSFEASTALEIRSEDPDGLAIRLGTMVEAERIDVRLRAVQGRVRFVGSLERIQDVLASHRAEPAVP